MSDVDPDLEVCLLGTCSSPLTELGAGWGSCLVELGFLGGTGSTRAEVEEVEDEELFLRVSEKDSDVWTDFCCLVFDIL